MIKIPIISIVDDDSSGRIGLSALIRSLGFEPRSFACAEDFLASSDRGHTACLITDVHMPGMTGLDLQSKLLREGEDIPIIFITAHPEESIRRRATDAGALRFLSKPFDGQLIVDCIEELFSKA